MIYYICFAIFLVEAFFCDVFTTRKIKKYENLFYVFGCILLIMLAGIRVDTGYDFQSYKNIFEYVKMRNLEHIFAGGWSLVVESGYIFINYLFKFFPFRIFIFVISAVSILLKTTFINRYVEKKMLCLFLYYSMFYLLYDMGIIRQGLAVGILLWAYDALIKENKIKFVGLVFFATLIHSSSFVFLIVYFIKDEKYSRKTYWMALFTAIGLSFIDMFGVLARNIPSSFIQNKIAYYINSANDDTIFNSIIKRLFVLLMIMFILNLKKIEANKPYIMRAFNSFYCSIILSILLFKVPILGGRGTGSLQIMQLLILPICFEKKYIKDENVIYRLFYILFFGGFAFYSMYSLINSHDYIPYKSMFG